MDITLIHPGIGSYNNKKSKELVSFPSLTTATLVGCAPEHSYTIIDDRIEDIDFSIKPDLIGITVDTLSALRAYTIAQRFRSQNIPVVMGGFHPSLLPDESKKYADSIVIGPGERNWPKLLNDFENNKMQRIYFSNHSPHMAKPNFSPLKNKKNYPLLMMETGRGCAYKCDFCSVTNFYNGYFAKSISQISEELESNRFNYIFFVDDSIASNQKRLEDLCTQIIPYDINWVGMATITIAKNKKLLDKMYESGCRAILIGFESMVEETLAEIGKFTKVSEYRESVKKIHDSGIQIYGTFALGYDFENPDSIKRSLDFSQEMKLCIANFYPLTPFPGTPLYSRLKSQNRLLHKNWWLNPDYYLGDVVFRPKNMTPKELSVNCDSATKEFYSTKSIATRFFNKSSCFSVQSASKYLIKNIFTRIEQNRRRNTSLGWNGS